MNASTLLLLGIVSPLVGGLVVWLLKEKLLKYLGHINLFFTALSLALIALAWFGFGREVVNIALPGFLYIGLGFNLNSLTAFFALLFAGAWVITSIYSLKYMQHEGSPCRFYTFLQLTLAGCLGVVLASDLITLFLFFELMTFCSFILVIHKEDKDAMSAGYLYLFLGVIGGLALLMGIFLLYNATGTVAFTGIPEAVAGNTGLMVAMGICFMIGFGLKAGMAPLHIWLPKAHPVAPTPASALLSGIMIKTGAFGLFRVFYSILVPSGQEGFGASLFGWAFLWLGLITMLMGAFLALQQRQAKRTLAYSSVSQIGYIIMGLGAALLPFGKDLYGVSGLLFHVLNHAVFKTTLFMSVGALYVYTHTLEFDNLGGLLRKYPVVSFSFIIAALGIMGMPGLNGYASKTFLHHALTDLYHYNPIWPLWLAEKVFVLASALTICYFIKLFLSIFWGEKDWSHLPDKMSPTLQAPLVIGAAAVIGIGLFPHQVIKAVIIPAMETVGFNHTALDYVAHVNVWNWSDLAGMGITAAVAGVLLLMVYKFKIDAIRFPQWLSVENLVYMPLARGFLLFCLGPGVFLDRKVNQIYHGTGGLSIDLCRFVGKVDKSIDNIYTHAGSFSTQICRAAGIFDKGLNDAYDKIGHSSMKACINLDNLDQDLDSLYKNLGLVYTRAAHKIDSMERKMSGPLPNANQVKNSSWVYKLQEAMESPTWNISNLNIEALVVALALVVVVIIFVFYGR